MVFHEIGKNIDGYVFSTYLYKAKDSDGGLLHMGPLWDFNLAFGNVDYLANAQFAPGWMWDDQYRMFWFRRMIQDPMFKTNLKCRWQTLRNGFLTNEYFTKKIDSIALTLQVAQTRNYQRWPILGQYVWPNQYVGQTYQDELNFLKQWIITRLAWMDSNMPGDCRLITAVEELKTIDLNVFPNPFKVSVKILFPTDYNGHILSVIDLTGREVFNVTISANELEWQGIDQQGRPLPKGLYLIRVSNKEGQTIAVRRIVRE